MGRQREQVSQVEQEQRAGLDRVVGRLQLVRPPERHWLEMMFLNGTSYRQLSGVTGIGRPNLTRRLKRIVANLRRDDYLTLWRKHQDLTRLQRKIAYDFFLLGRSPRQIAFDLRRSRLTIQKIIDKLRDIIAEEKERTQL